MLTSSTVFRRVVAAGSGVVGLQRRASSAHLHHHPLAATSQRSMCQAAFTDDHVAALHRDGFVCVPRFIDDATIDSLQTQFEHLVNTEAAHRKALAAGGSNAAASVFDPYAHSHTSDEYFMTSGNKVRYFLEKGETELRTNTTNKVGHALHTVDDVFRSFITDHHLGGICRKLGVMEPSVIQSMYIVKPPKVGGEVAPHQDSTWLYTTPLSVIGIWFALDDCDVSNGCLTAIQGSHRTHMPLSARCMLDEGSVMKSTLIGNMPIVPDRSVMQPIECPKGSLVVFNGQLIHASSQNLSDRWRHAFVIHAVDDRCQWSERNWLSPTVARLRL